MSSKKDGPKTDKSINEKMKIDVVVLNLKSKNYINTIIHKWADPQSQTMYNLLTDTSSLYYT